MKKFCKAVLLLSAVTLMGTAASVQADAKTKVKVSKVTVKSNYGSRVRVAVGKKIKLKTTVKVKPNKAANKKVTYKSSNKKIATVSASGYVKGVKAGTCKIKVTSKKNKKKKATMKVTVVKKVSSIKLAASTKEIYAGESVTVTPTVLPATGSYKGVTWSSSNKKVATVDKNGKVTAKKAGTATITVKSANGKKATCKVTVPSITLKSTKATLKVGKSTPIKVKETYPKKEKVTYKSSNTKVATVNSKGKVVGKKAGKATITVTTKSGATAKFKVTVKK